jgi:potassium-transporting ATPase potassium-binding subunit
MTTVGWLQIIAFALTIVALTKPIGIYQHRVFEGPQPLPRVFGPIERLLHRLCGVDPRVEHTWQQYSLALLVFSTLTLLATYGIERLQYYLPFNPQGFSAPSEHLAWNTAVSFTTNTNWQSYAGESTMSDLTQMAGLAWHNFLSAGAGLGVAFALARALTRKRGPNGPQTIGNFWVDLLRSLVYVLLPASVVIALLFVWMGMIQSLSPYLEIDTLEGGKQLIAMGPVASQEVIKQLGTNGGGFFNANSSHPFENPTPLSNFIELVLVFAIPAGLTYTYGRMAADARQGWAIFAAMAVLFVAGVSTAYWAEAQSSPALTGIGSTQSTGNMEGKETRFGVSASALFATVTTAASCGAVNSMHDSFTPLGGLVPLVNMQLGEVIFGGVGAGLYGMLVMVLLSVFIAGLMVGRTPEYLGKKIEPREMKLAMLYVLVFPLLILVPAGWSAVAPYGVSSLHNAGPHGLSEILYAYSSGAANNGSAFAGLNANTPWWNISLGLAMLIGRFAMIVPVLAIAGSMVAKKTAPPGPGTFPTGTALFSFLLVAVVVIVGALTFFPALNLAPIIEHFIAREGRAF